MKKYIISLLILFFCSESFGQTITQTYIDPCDQKVYVVIIPFGQNQTVAVIRGKSKIVTLADISSGAFQTWVNSIFATPCPQNDAIRLAQEAAARAAAEAAESGSGRGSKGGSRCGGKGGSRCGGKGGGGRRIVISK